MERARGLSFVRSLLAMEPLSETGWVKILGTVGLGVNALLRVCLVKLNSFGDGMKEA